MKKVLVIPQYNEALTVTGVLDDAYPHIDYLVVVDDGSTDHSGQLIHRWAEDKQGVAVLTLDDNRGMAGALLVGFCFVLDLVYRGLLATDDVMITIDADGQHLPGEIPLLVDELVTRNLDLVLGRRHLAGYPWFKWVGNAGLSLWASLLTGCRYRDVECGFRAMRLDVLADLLAYFDGRKYGCAQEIAVITACRGWNISNDLPVHVAYYRRGAQVSDGVTNLLAGLRSRIRVMGEPRYQVPERVRRRLDQVKRKEFNMDAVRQQVAAAREPS